MLEQPAIIYYAMLNEGYKHQAEHYLMLAKISLLDRLDSSDIEDFVEHLRLSATDLSDMLNTDDEGSSSGDIKKLLGGK